MLQSHEHNPTARRYDIITVGSSTEDVMVQCSDARVITLADRNGEAAWMAFEYGGKIHVDDITIMVGGGAVNTAITFAQQGMRTAMISKVGRDSAGERIAGRNAAAFALDQ